MGQFKEQVFPSFFSSDHFHLRCLYSVKSHVFNLTVHTSVIFQLLLTGRYHIYVKALCDLLHHIEICGTGTVLRSL